jgi:2-polyprenyl-3-methyl-5-hydroxy-6-metoxy-1,4-benzoquinol methylase
VTTSSYDLLTLALARLADSWATRTIPAKVREPGYDLAFAQRICTLAFDKCGADIDSYGIALNDFIALSEEFVQLQIELDRTGHYLYSSYAEVRAKVYDNPAVMERRYLNGLLLSQAFWTNHMKLFRYFIERFCRPAKSSGTVLEVPCGTGIYISEFARRNPAWFARGIDLSESSVAFSKEIARLSAAAVSVLRQDVFALPQEPKYDRIICGELLEHLEDPEALLEKLAAMVAPGGRIFLTTAIWAANIDHIYLFTSADEVRSMLAKRFTIESELALAVRDGFSPDQERTPINYACVLAAAAGD